MIKVLLPLFIFISTNFAMASLARVSALQSNHLKDTEYTYLFPTKLLELPDFILLQSGATLDPIFNKRPYVAIKSTFLPDQSDHYALGLTLGRQSDLVDIARERTNAAMATNFERTSNSVDLAYAIRNEGNSYSLGFFYADQNDKANQVGNHAGTLNLGIRIDDFTFSTNIGLFNYVDDLATNSHLSINQSFMGALVYEMDDIHFILDLSSSRAKRDVSSTETNNIELLNYKMGVVKTTYNGNETVFYRINLETDHVKNRIANSNNREIRLPLTLGFESVLTDEIKLRSSIKQIVGVYQSDDFTAGQNTTSAAVGVGLNYKKITIDGTLQGLIGSTASQQLSANQLLTETSLTYWF
jgi:hypothetical protein